MNRRDFTKVVGLGAMAVHSLPLLAGEGILNFQIITETLSRLSPGVALQVETISNSARSIPFLKPGFWKGFPEMPSANLIVI